ncbi:hypothetical protein [Alkalibacterium kapii]|uniref:Lipoprotein n=1 Tax=Alkalibacterium kapii TaxID=426704 RepID=A0A511AV70_9LACT|nr:hypothetical protein [Alkalibacterium kapii]GEK92046.1 hypothetical protein AKA01nite_16680 [Alkalibacterium kapii]
MNKRYLGLLTVGVLFLGACSSEQDLTDSDTNGEAEIVDAPSEENDAGESDMDNRTNTEEPDSEQETANDTDLEEVTELDEELQMTLGQDFEEINWDEIHLTRGQFDTALEEFQESTNAAYDEDESMDIYIDTVDFTGDTIEVTLTNNDKSEFSEMTNGLLAVFMDSFYRQLYLHSDYSDGNTHPLIIIKTSDGEIITDQKDFLEFEEQP